MDPRLGRQAQCGCRQNDEIVQILLGDEIIGLVALDQIFEQLYKLGRAPDELVKDELLKMVAARNYIPRQAETEYATGLLSEYRKYCERKVAQSV